MENSKSFSNTEFRPDKERGLLDDFLSNRQLEFCRLQFKSTPPMVLKAVDLELLARELDKLGPAGLAAEYLVKEEQHRFFSFRFPKRQIEWLGGRMAAKQSAALLTSPVQIERTNWQSWRIQATGAGRPYISTGQNYTLPGPDISISHSGSWAAATATIHGHCGLDLQKITPKISRIKERFAEQQEINLLKRVPTLLDYAEHQLLTILWAAKESLRKGVICQPLLGFKELRLIGLTGDIQPGLCGLFTCSRPEMPETFTTFITMKDDYACAVSMRVTIQHDAKK